MSKIFDLQKNYSFTTNVQDNILILKKNSEVNLKLKIKNY